MANVEAVLVECLFEAVDLSPRGLHLGLPDLGKKLWTYVGSQQSDDDHDHQQFKQGKSARPDALKHGRCMHVGSGQAGGIRRFG